MNELLATLFCLTMLISVIVAACWDVNRDHKPPTPVDSFDKHSEDAVRLIVEDQR